MTAPSLPALKALLARVEAAEGDDRELDLELHNTFWPSMASVATDVGRFCGSIDAALAFFEAVLPGWYISILTEKNNCRVWCMPPVLGPNPTFAMIPQIALAIIAATLKAKIAEGERDA